MASKSAITIVLDSDDDNDRSPPTPARSTSTNYHEWLISDMGHQLEKIMQKLQTRKATEDWNEDILQLAAEDWLQLESYGIAWIHSYAIEFSQTYHAKESEFYDKLCSLCYYRMYPDQFPLLQPANEFIIPFEFDVLAFPVHNRTDQTNSDHWSLLLYFLDENTSPVEIIRLYHLDSLNPYNRDVALAYANRLHSLHFFVPSPLSRTMKIQVNTIEEYPRQPSGSTDCGSRVVQCLRDLTRLCQTHRANPKMLYSLYRKRKEEECRLQPLEMLHSLRAAVGYPMDLPQHTVQYIPMCTAQYRPHLVVWSEEMFRFFIDHHLNQVPYFIWVTKTPSNEYQITVVQPRQLTNTIYSSSPELRREARDQNKNWNVVHVNTPVLSRGGWHVASRLLEYLVRFCDTDRTVPRHSSFGDSLGKLLFKDGASRRYELFYKRMEQKYESRLRFHTMSINRPWIPQFDLFYEPEGDYESFSCDYEEYVFVYKGLDQLILNNNQVTSLLARYGEEFTQAVKTTPESKSFVRGTSHDGPYPTADKRFIKLYLLTSSLLVDPEKWKRIKFTLDIWLVLPSHDNERQKEEKNARLVMEQLSKDHGHNFDAERFMVSLLRLFIALVM